MRLWLQEARIKSGLSQKEVAQQTFITHQFYNYVENGKRHPSNKIAKRIASVLGFDWTRFEDEREDKTAS